MKTSNVFIHEDFAVVELTRGYCATIDLCDVNMVMQFKWYAVVAKHTVYASRVLPRKDGRQDKISMHRMIFGETGGMNIDHIDMNGLNNRRENLRIADDSQNQYNTRITSRNKSGFKGVHFKSSRGKYVASIRVDRKLLFLGSFIDAEDAHAAYCLASAKYHGFFGRTK